MRAAAQRFLHADGAGSLLSTRPMSFYELQARFWQLEAEQPFSATETKFYFYWLNRFNAERWPAQLRRFLKQVAADVSLDEKSVARAAAGLQGRGLLAYQPGTRSQAATWKLSGDDRKISAPYKEEAPRTFHDERNFSAQDGKFGARTSGDDRKISAPYKEEAPRTFHDERNFSAQDGKFGARTSGDDRKISAPYKEEEKTVGKEEEKTPPTGAAGAAGGGPEKKIGESLSPESPDAQASHTRGGAAPAPRPKPPKAGEPPAFTAFWAAWPRREAKADALRAFGKLALDDQAAAASRAERWLAARPDLLTAERQRFIPHPATWLNQARWTDANPQPATAQAHATANQSFSPRSLNGFKPDGDGPALARALAERSLQQ